MRALTLAAAGTRGALRVAPALPRALLGPAPVNDRGEVLDPSLHAVLTFMRRTGRGALDHLGAAAARAEYERLGRLLDLPDVPLPSVRDISLDGPAGPIPARIYRPRSGLLPALVYFHGGGFVIGSLETHDRLCRFFARAADVAVVAVDYRLAPEHPFPAAPEDARAAFLDVVARAEALEIDPRRVAVGGDSAGGNLSAGVCQALAAGEPRPAFQLLIYPGVDMTRSADSHKHFGEGFLLDATLMDWFLANYLTSPADERDPRASPLCTADLRDLPPALVVVAGFDPLRDEGEAYARALMEAGVPTTLRSYGSLVHGFATMAGGIVAARRAVEDLAAALREALHA